MNELPSPRHLLGTDFVGRDLLARSRTTPTIPMRSTGSSGRTKPRPSAMRPSGRSISLGVTKNSGGALPALYRRRRPGPCSQPANPVIRIHEHLEAERGRRASAQDGSPSPTPPISVRPIPFRQPPLPWSLSSPPPRGSQSLSRRPLRPENSSTEGTPPDDARSRSAPERNSARAR